MTVFSFGRGGAHRTLWKRHWVKKDEGNVIKRSEQRAAHQKPLHLFLWLLVRPHWAHFISVFWLPLFPDITFVSRLCWNILKSEEFNWWKLGKNSSFLGHVLWEIVKLEKCFPSLCQQLDGKSTVTTPQIFPGKGLGFGLCSANCWGILESLVIFRFTSLK